MIEVFKRVSNPLTVIAIFAGLAEIAGTVVLPLMDKEIQLYFVWYVMGFPLILVGLFFCTLWKNHKVLYAPSDFKNDDTFVTLAQRSNSVLKVASEGLEKLEETALTAVKSDSPENSKVIQEISSQLITIKQLVESAKASNSAAIAVTQDIDVEPNLGDLGRRVLRYLAKNGGRDRGVPLRRIYVEMLMASAWLRRALDALREHGLVTLSRGQSGMEGMVVQMTEQGIREYEKWERNEGRDPNHGA